MGYTCDTHPGEPGALLITNLGNGDTVVLCPACIPDWSAALAASFTGFGPAAATSPESDDPDDEPGDEPVPDQGQAPAAPDTPAEPEPGPGLPVPDPVEAPVAAPDPAPETPAGPAPGVDPQLAARPG